MESAAAPPWVAATQHALGPLVSAPPSSVALRRPTFHMLHSMVFEVKSATTFGEGAYTAEEEFGSDALSAEDQNAFLCKAVGLVGASLGSPIRLQVSAALRGDEAEATNLFLQRLAEVRKCTRCMHPPRPSTPKHFSTPPRRRPLRSSLRPRHPHRVAAAVCRSGRSRALPLAPKPAEAQPHLRAHQAPRPAHCAQRP